MNLFFQGLISGISIGCIYALVALVWLVPDRRVHAAASARAAARAEAR